MRVLGADLRSGDVVYISTSSPAEGEWLELEDVGPSIEDCSVIEAFHGTRAIYLSPDGFYDRRARRGEYVAIDLDENNHHAIKQRAERHPGVKFPLLGWGICRHGYGLQDLPPLSERQARKLSAKLNATEGVRT